jgi:hypothetical protein
MSRSTFLVLLALVVQQSAARITPTRIDGDVGRQATVDAFMKFEAAEEDKLFFDRALAGHMMSASMSMMMSMSMPMAPMVVDGATGTSSATVDEVVIIADTTPKADVASTPVLEPVNSITSTDSSASKAVIGFSCIVGAMGALLF